MLNHIFTLASWKSHGLCSQEDPRGHVIVRMVIDGSRGLCLTWFAASIDSPRIEQCSFHFIHFQYCRTVVLSFLFHFSRNFGDPVQWVKHYHFLWLKSLIIYIYTHIMVYSHTIRILYITHITHYSYNIYIYTYTTMMILTPINIDSQ